MKRIAVVAMEKQYAKYLRDNLALYLSNYAEICYYTVAEVERMEQIPEEFVLVSAFTIFQRVKEKIKETSELIVISITLNKEKVEPLRKLSKGTRALLVNIDERTCMQVITSLYAAGFRNVELIPYWGTNGYDESIKLAITPDEEWLVPDGMEKIINIGERIIDLNCIYDIADKLGAETLFGSREAFEAKNNMYFGNANIERILGLNKNLSGRIEALLHLMDQGIIITDVLGKVCLHNDKAQAFLRRRSELLIGFDMLDILPELKAFTATNRKENSDKELIEINGENLVVSLSGIVQDGEHLGNVIILDNFEKIEEQQHGLRSKLSGVDHEARYHFEDIKGKSEELEKVITAAKRMARSDSSVLITGESGVGKEVFAQSIHNESSRASYNFVAVNCAAIPENLLESEMFGYEEGSFTGARKGGKIGYFELAHKGTIFLDEIGEMPLLLQSKLLRVIEERKIVKIGSHKVVNVDVRIIAATNKDLMQLVCEGNFREDLYYRINVLPLQIPSLRERSEDIMNLLEWFLSLMDCSFTFSHSAKKIIERYPWQGNIRELRNAAEYLANLNKVEIDVVDLPPSLRNFAKDAEGPRGIPAAENAGGSILKKEKEYSAHFNYRFLLREGKRVELFLFILSELAENYQCRKRIGRSGLMQRALKEGSLFTEAEIRTALRKLDDFGFVSTGIGRGGSVITESGFSLLNDIKGLIG
ncbi:sigma-54 interaction domain-containing protein [Sinanaerobacter sp. ZZT-01]|uniref:sigma-54 interaction domain-containing protein n=1 Tax=Sinanaerobacter sp. ZZT-01 TaxID=3111540 RepID=UPI002D7A1456|nr:sigma 54-interacting transcriptional regulator [Sinanaerobacter sp. ZZT-01]WRR95033.1 sigma 54-interacting transcriptional regulator [Sinanaerobacter sp. ZZT-01]